MTAPFCETCNRLRITAEGTCACLFSLEETDLRGPLRSGASDDDLEAQIRGNVWRKWSGHWINHPDFRQPERSMSAIGGWTRSATPIRSGARAASRRIVSPARNHPTPAATSANRPNRTIPTPGSPGGSRRSS